MAVHTPEHRSRQYRQHHRCGRYGGRTCRPGHPVFKLNADDALARVLPETNRNQDAIVEWLMVELEYARAKHGKTGEMTADATLRRFL